MKAVVDGLLQASPFVLYSLLAATTALGQITPDNTLGNESSVVTPNVNVNGTLIDLIEGGAIRESNLFHSFQDFNVAEFGRVYFANPAGVANILSRVTGTNVSNILGTLGVLDNANLFLINPNGIVFGANSRLDIRGSFFGSTADSVLFDNGFQFSATNPDAPPLLTIKGPLGLQYGENSGSIRAQGISGFQSFVQGLGLRVQPGKTLALVGSDITLERFFLEARGGRIELGSVAGPGMVSLTPKGKGWVLGYEGIENFRDIEILRSFISNSVQEQNDLAAFDSDGAISIRGSQLDIGRTSIVRATTFTSLPGGDITIDVRQLTLRDGANLSSNAFDEGKAGNLTVNASESVKVIDGLIQFRFSSSLSASTFGAGDGGDILINTDFFLVQNGGQVNTSTSGGGDAGNLTMNASEVQVIGGLLPSILSTQANPGATGNAGNLKITTGELMVSDGAIVSAGTVGEGDGGNLIVDATESVQLMGTSADGQFVSGLFSQTLGTGNGGDVSITTGELMVSDGAQILASPIGLGNGGNLTVDADEKVQVIGTDASGRFPSALSTQTQGTGKAGNLKITTGELMVSDGAQVAAGTFSEGEGGELIVDTSSTVQVIGTSADGRIVSGLFSQTEGTGKARDVKITTGELIVSDGAAVSASTFGIGNGGNLTVDADEKVQVIGTSASGGFVSGLSTQGNPGATGNAGDLNITTGKLIVSDGARVSASTFGLGNAGNLSFNTSSTVQLIGNFTSASGRFNRGITPDAGNLLEITTGQLIVSDGAVSTRSFQQENSAGEVKINANSIFLNNDAIIAAETAGGDKGNITLFSRNIRLLKESKITTNAQNATGGNIEIDTDTLLGLGNSDITANAQEGPGGRVEINAQGIFGLEFRDRETPDNDITATSTLGPSFSGEVILNTPDVDPTSGLTELPGSPVDAEAILANDLCGFENNRIAGGSSFFITGKGGLPASADDAVINTDRTVGWLSRPGLPSSSRQRLQQQPLVTQPQPPQEKKVIIEALGWVTAKDGTIILTAQPFRGTPVEQILPNLDCHSGRGSRE
ncbi:S-layer family protein [Moorena sp. SIO4G3]|uniref:S-layer family protein n=1 Tax=Moorena sp. SIO4G3 TaxID=2607821 RepID=UPI0025F0E4EF|nr:S-layer family protein [Moorena sp. SIO4G3]